MTDGQDQPSPDIARDAIRRLGAADRAALKRAGLIDFEDGENAFLSLLWTVKETFYWTQNFPAGRELRISHRYKPGAGSSAGIGLERRSRNEPYARRMMRDYCVDRAFLAGIDRMTRAEQYPQSQTFGYVLKTGANWRSPIRNFRLVVDKGDPRNIVSFCGENVRRISPTQFEVRHTNWRPTRDLRVLVALPVE